MISRKRPRIPFATEQQLSVAKVMDGTHKTSNVIARSERCAIESFLMFVVLKQSLKILLAKRNQAIPETSFVIIQAQL